MMLRRAVAALTRWTRTTNLSTSRPASAARDNSGRRFRDWRNWLDDREHLWDAMRLDSAEDRELLAEILADAGAEVSRPSRLLSTIWRRRSPLSCGRSV